jgi:hypothetical protein
MTEYSCFYKPVTNKEEITTEEWIKRYKPISDFDFDYYNYLDVIDNHHLWTVLEDDDGGFFLSTGFWGTEFGTHCTEIPWKERLEVWPIVSESEEDYDIWSGNIHPSKTRDITREEYDREWKELEEKGIEEILRVRNLKIKKYLKIVGKKDKDA